ncbi:MAG TPA: hypothetical protein PLZ09_05315 [Clostridia bacterium]|nr:hypothetical protein [Clostridia bacterium]
MDLLAEILEIAMLVCFGCSWPISVYKSIKIRTSVGKSAVFNILLIVGYIAGIVSKFLKMEPFMIANAADGLKKGIFIFALIMYFGNLAMITANLVLYYMNKNLDNKRAIEIANTNNNAEVVNNIAEEIAKDEQPAEVTSEESEDKAE